MTFTNDDLQALQTAFVSGALRVRIGDRDVIYRSQADLVAAINFISAMLQNQTDPTATPTQKNNVQVSWKKGSLV